MRAAILQNGVVVNVLEVSSITPGQIDGDGANIGDTWNGSIFIKPTVAPVIPESVSPRQFRQSLTHSGFRANIEAAISAADQDTKDWYSFATSFERSHPIVTAMAQSLGYTSAQIDAVWTYGASI